MKIVEKINGLGKIDLSYDEEKKIGILDEIITGDGIKYFIGKDSPRTAEYKAIMEELFPGLPLSYRVFKRSTDRLVDKNKNRFIDGSNKHFGNFSELVISSKFPIKTNTFSEAELSIFYQ